MLQGLTEEFLHKFGQRLARLLAPQIPTERIQECIRQVIEEANAASARQAAPPQQPAQPPSPASLELAFVHDCRYVHCPFLTPVPTKSLQQSDLFTTMPLVSSRSVAVFRVSFYRCTAMYCQSRPCPLRMCRYHADATVSMVVVTRSDCMGMPTHAL